MRHDGRQAWRSRVGLGCNPSIRVISQNYDGVRVLDLQDVSERIVAESNRPDESSSVIQPFFLRPASVGIVRELALTAIPTRSGRKLSGRIIGVSPYALRGGLFHHPV